MAKRKKIPVDGSAEITVDTVMGDLLRDSGLAPETKPEREAPEKNPSGADPQAFLLDMSNAGKMILRVQRKGMGGKTVTILTCQGLASNQLGPLAKGLRKGLGCGSRIDEDDIVLQGDVTDRAARWLRDRGVKKIVGVS